MAKVNYGIPYPLDSTYLDMEIAIQNNQGLGLKPFAIKNILLVLTGVVSCFLLVNKTFIARGSIGQKVIFVILWGLLCFLLLTSNKQKQLGFEKITSLLTYTQPDNWFVSTRSNDKANNLIRICGFDEIDDTDVIHYTDGTLGVMFDVIGNASILLFEDHKNMILDRVDSHYRKMKPNTSYQFVTRKEPQNVYMQVASFEERKQELTCYDQDLMDMFETNEYVMSNLVGQRFKSLRQYLIIQAPNKEELDLALNVFFGEVENSSLMFKYAEQLDRDEIIQFYTDIYGTRKEF